jgi:uncharacterized protein YkwD
VPLLCVVLLALAVSAVPGLAAAAAPSARAGDGPGGNQTLAADLVASLNAARRANGLRGVRSNAALRRAALEHALSMAQDGYFSHSSANGDSASTRITSYYRVRSERSWSVGEVLYWASGNVSSDAVVGAWLSSPPHRAELLARRWRDVGVAAVYVPNAPGVYRGLNVTIVVVDFGVRR